MSQKVFFSKFNICFRPAPLLKDCDISETKARELYLECIHIIRTLYHTCRLIHADLSEFNML